jgi:hypothetical protein
MLEEVVLASTKSLRRWVQDERTDTLDACQNYIMNGILIFHIRTLLNSKNHEIVARQDESL